MLKIVKATYGEADVTQTVAALVKNDELRLRASNDLFGDPQPGVVKTLTVITQDRSYSAEENSFLCISAKKVERLGIFYSNNNVKPVVKESLLTLTKFKGIADILTCVWEPIPGNPFYEAIAHTKTSSHLNIIIQVLQLLYTARQTGEYKYVSFLEHDVLYPDGYFDFPDFSDSVMTNMNYKGICSNGFQDRDHAHEPLHQMTMVFDDAVSHFERILLTAISTGQVLVEPSDIKRAQWSCENPAVHVNHGKHFTSHFSIYSKATHDSDVYWGKSADLISRLFN